MARDLGSTADKAFDEEEEVGAELIAVLSRQQRELRAGAPLPKPATPLGPMA